MQDIKKRQDIMQEKRKKTPWRHFVKEIASWYPIVLYRNKWTLSRYPDTIRSPLLQSWKTIKTYLSTEHIEKKTFFEKFKALFLTIPMEALIHFPWIENSDYADIISSSKNAYLSWNVTQWNENVVYSLWVKENSKNIFNSVMVWSNSDTIHWSTGIINSFKVFYSRYIYNSSNIKFSINMMNCHDCIFCNNLENKSYCVNNKQYTKQEYKKVEYKYFKEKWLFSNRHKKINSFWAVNYWSTNVEGNFILHSYNVKNGCFVYNIRNSHNVILWWYSYEEEYLYDAMFSWAKSDCYGILCCWSKSQHIYNCFWLQSSFNMYYCYKCSNCSFCLWCIWLENKQFCIFNKQYTKEERFELANKIFAQMDQEWVLWEFFPASINPFYFNDTVAYLIDDSFTKQEVEAEWYLRRDEEIKVDIPVWTEAIKTTELDQYQWFDSEWNRTIDPSILKKVIIDEKWNFYRIVKIEYDFLVKHWLPLPEIHGFDRIKLGFKFEHTKN